MKRSKIRAEPRTSSGARVSSPAASCSSESDSQTSRETVLFETAAGEDTRFPRLDTDRASLIARGPIGKILQILFHQRAVLLRIIFSLRLLNGRAVALRQTRELSAATR